MIEVGTFFVRKNHADVGKQTPHMKTDGAGAGAGPPHPSTSRRRVRYKKRVLIYIISGSAMGIRLPYAGRDW